MGFKNNWKIMFYSFFFWGSQAILGTTTANMEDKVLEEIYVLDVS